MELIDCFRRERQQRSIELAAPIQITPLEYFYKKENWFVLLFGLAAPLAARSLPPSIQSSLLEWNAELLVMSSRHGQQATQTLLSLLSFQQNN